MKKTPQSLKSIFKDAHQNYRKGNITIAESSCYKILSIDTNHIEAKILLANICANNKDYKKGKILLKEVIDSDPKNISALNNLGIIYRALREHSNAKNCYEQVIKINPKNPNAYYNLGALFYELNDLQEAKSSFYKSTDLEPGFAIAFLALGNAHKALKENESAIKNYQQAININSNLVSAHNNLGLVFRNINDLDNAIKCYKKAIQVRPDHIGAHHNLALALKEIGKFDESAASHKIAIEHEPENLSHYYYLSEIQPNILKPDLKIKIEEVMKKNTSNKNNLAFGNYLISKFKKKENFFEEEMKHLKRGHQGFYEMEKNKFDLVINYYFKDMLQIEKEAKIEKSSSKYESELSPIFIIGVPRSGSTLIEKIIASGKTHVPMGEEISVFEDYITKKIMDKKSLNLGDVSTIRLELINAYKQKGLILKKNENIFTDKTLNNFFYLRLIKIIYPNSKIIHCTRDITSSVMSIYQNNLSELAWAHDLNNIFQYFDNCFKIIKNFKKENPNTIYNLEYEKLVNNPIEESKKIMDYCELTWSKKCLEFYKRKDLVSKTASNVQIRNRIYKNSLNKYLPYKSFLNEYGKKYSWFN